MGGKEERRGGRHCFFSPPKAEFCPTSKGLIQVHFATKQGFWKVFRYCVLLFARNTEGLEKHHQT